MKLTYRDREVLAAAIAFHAPLELRRRGAEFGNHWHEELSPEAVSLALEIFKTEETRMMALVTATTLEDEAEGIAYEVARVRSTRMVLESIIESRAEC